MGWALSENNELVILNSFQDNMLRRSVVLKQVQLDEGECVDASRLTGLPAAAPVGSEGWWSLGESNP